MYKSIKLRIIFTIILAILAGILFNKIVIDSNEKVQIVVAAKTIPERTVIEESDLKIISISKEDYELMYPQCVKDPQDIVGAITKVELKINRPIEKDSKVIAFDEEKPYALKGEGSVDTSFFIPSDKRLISIEVDRTGSVNNKIDKGDYIDVIFSSVDQSTGGLYSIMLLQHMQVFEVSDDSNQNAFDNEKKVIVLLASPQESVTLAAAGRNGILDCVLNPLSGETQEVPAVNVHSFVVDAPRSKIEELEYLKNYVSKLNISATGEEKITNMIEEELAMDKLIEFITDASINDDVKNELLDTLK